ncbi:MAG: sigma-70 family RNA polymerase sigma factor [Planctomycetota bacterium]
MQRRFEFPDTQTAILEGVRNPGDKEAFERFFECYFTALREYFRSLAPNAEESDEWCSQFVLKLYTSLPDVPEKLPKGQFRRYLVKMVRNFAADRFRSKKMRADRFSHRPVDDYAIPMDASQKQLEDSVDEGTTAYRVKSAMQRVERTTSPRDWMVFSATVLQEVPIDSVASDFELTRTTIYQIRTRIRRKIKIEMDAQTWA